MPAPTLSTPADRIGARDAATAYWYEHAERIDEGEITTSYERTTMARLHFVRESLATDFAAKMTDEGRIVISDEHGNTLTLEWDGRIDGFDYPTSGDDACDLGEEEAQREAEPEPETDGKVIDITPTWTSMIGMLACLIERGGESRRVAIAELTRLAQFADAKNAEGTPHRIALLEVARVALSTPMRETVTEAMDISDEVADELLAEANRLLAD